MIEAGFFELAKELLQVKSNCNSHFNWVCVGTWFMGIKCNRLFFAELSGGVPSLTVSHRSGELFLQLSQKVNVADRRWHNIKIINDGKASVNIDSLVEALFWVPSYPFQILSFFCRALLSISLSPSLQQQELKFVSSGVPLVLKQ